MSKYFFSTLVFVLVFGSLLTACKQSEPPFECSDAIGCVDIGPDEPLKLGVIQDLSGGGAVYGIDQRNTSELVVAERDGKLFGHPIELQVEDEQCSSEGGANAALRIVADPQVVGILGTTCSSAASAAGNIMSEAGLVMVSGVNSAVSLTSVGGKAGEDWQAGYFRTMPNIMEEGGAGATFAFEELGASKAAIINDGDTFSRGYADTFLQTFVELGGEVVLDATVNKGDEDMRPLLRTVVASEAELVFLALFPPEGARFVQQARETIGFENITLIGGGSLRTEDYMKAAVADSVGVYFIGSSPPPAGAANDELLAAYEARYDEPPQTLTYGRAYDAANLLLNAIETVAVQDKDGTLHIGRQALRDALYATSGLEGLTGRLTCDEFGDCATVKFDIVRLDDPATGLEGLTLNVIYSFDKGQ